MASTFLNCTTRGLKCSACAADSAAAAAAPAGDLRSVTAAKEELKDVSHTKFSPHFPNATGCRAVTIGKTEAQHIPLRLSLRRVVRGDRYEQLGDETPTRSNNVNTLQINTSTYFSLINNKR